MAVVLNFRCRQQSPREGVSSGTSMLDARSLVTERFKVGGVTGDPMVGGWVPGDSSQYYIGQAMSCQKTPCPEIDGALSSLAAPGTVLARPVH